MTRRLQRDDRKLIEGKRYAAKPFEFTGELASTIVRTSTDELKTTERSRACLLNRSSIDLSGLAESSVDLVLTDPPFYNNLAYSELSDFYYQWLHYYFVSQASMYDGATTPVESSLLVRRKTSSEHGKYLKECGRVLKKDGMLVFTFHHRKQRLGRLWPSPCR